MSFMLIALMVFFLLVGMLALTVLFSGVRKSANLLQGENAMLLASKLANSPEFSCGESFGKMLGDCIDADKVMILKDRKQYENFWGISNIEIRKIYPKLDSEIECTKGNYPNCNRIKVFSGKEEGIGTSNFISLCRKDVSNGEINNKCELAKLIITYTET